MNMEIKCCVFRKAPSQMPWASESCFAVSWQLCGLRLLVMDTQSAASACRKSMEPSDVPVGNPAPSGRRAELVSAPGGCVGAVAGHVHVLRVLFCCDGEGELTPNLLAGLLRLEAWCIQRAAPPFTLLQCRPATWWQRALIMTLSWNSGACLHMCLSFHGAFAIIRSLSSAASPERRHSNYKCSCIRKELVEFFLTSADASMQASPGSFARSVNVGFPGCLAWPADSL